MSSKQIKCTRIFTNYILYSDGRVLNEKTGQYLRGYLDKDGYHIMNIKGKHLKVHRLVAIHFIPNPNNLPEVNHKDHDRLNNNDWNLEWCTHQDNNKHSLHLVIASCAKRYDFISPQGVHIEVYNLREFCRNNNLQQSHMVKVAKGKVRHHKGWTNYARC